MNIVKGRNVVNGALTKQETQVRNKYKKLEAEKGDQEALQYQTDNPKKVLYESNYFDNATTKSYKATFGIAPPPTKPTTEPIKEKQPTPSTEPINSKIQFENLSRHIDGDPTAEVNMIFSKVTSSGTSDYSIKIIGNTGGDGTRKFSDSPFYLKLTVYKNFAELALARANRIKELLVERGLDPSKITTELGDPNKGMNAEYKVTTVTIK